MGLSRFLDKSVGLAVAEGTVTAPENVRLQLGICAKCSNDIKTHGYDLILEYGSNSSQLFSSVIFCESCFYKHCEQGFWLTTIRQICYLLIVIGVILLILSNITSYKTENIIASIVGCLLILPFITILIIKNIHTKRNFNFFNKYFAHTRDCEYGRSPFGGWCDIPKQYCVPCALAVIVNKDQLIEDITISQLKNILMGVSIGTERMNLYLAPGPWREWVFVKRLSGTNISPENYIELDNPARSLEKIAQDKDGIGFISLPWLDHKSIEGIKILKVNGQDCLPENSNYPLWITAYSDRLKPFNIDRLVKTQAANLIP
jgi:hypothetical protein